MRPKRRPALILSLLATALLWVPPSAGADEPPLDPLVRDRTEKFVAKGGVLGIIVGVVRGDETVVVGAGRCGLTNSRAPDESTLFEIGSISKTFTGILLADAILRGEVQLEQPLSEILAVKVPDFEGQPIRLVDLATHTSGLPKIPTNLHIVNPLNPYASYTMRDLEQFLADYKLTRKPGEKSEYSNVGMGLVGEALAKRTGKTYEALLLERLCGPLGLHNTVITLSEDQHERMAGAMLLGLPAMNWDIPVLGGAGAIRSTMHDMLIYLRTNMDPDSTPIAEAIRSSHQPHFTVTKPTAKKPDTFQLGLAWHISTSGETQILFHNGMTGGYCALLMCVPAKRLGIVLMCNTAYPPAFEFGEGPFKKLMAMN